VKACFAQPFGFGAVADSMELLEAIKVRVTALAECFTFGEVFLFGSANPNRFCRAREIAATARIRR
jgi:hypothetical protein